MLPERTPGFSCTDAVYTDRQVSGSASVQWRFWGLHLGGGGVAIIAAGGHGPILPQ